MLLENNDSTLKGSDKSRKIVRPQSHLHISEKDLGAASHAGRVAPPGKEFNNGSDACAHITTLRRVQT